MAISYGNIFDFQQNKGMLRVLIRIASMRQFLMNTHNIQFHDKLRKFPSIFVFLSYRKNSVGTKN